jgi:AcrR family transcriptional regulator
LQSLLLERGAGAFSISDISERAGAAQGTFYNYASSVDDLIEELAALLSASLAVLGRRAPCAETDPVAAFVFKTRRTLGISVQAPDYGRLLFDSGLPADRLLADLRREARRDDLFMHVNLTARELTKSTIPALIDALMNSYDLPKRAIRVELTEQAALRDETKTLASAMALKAVGAGLVLDDFGTGHSSFAWLADLPFDSLKIDHGLTAKLGQARTDTILATITLLASRLNMSTTAEGVEKREDAARLRALGFDNAQGFAFSKGIDAKAALNFLKG